MSCGSFGVNLQAYRPGRQFCLISGYFEQLQLCRPICSFENSHNRYDITRIYGDVSKSTLWLQPRKPRRIILLKMKTDAAVELSEGMNLSTSALYLVVSNALGINFANMFYLACLPSKTFRLVNLSCMEDLESLPLPFKQIIAIGYRFMHGSELSCSTTLWTVWTFPHTRSPVSLSWWFLGRLRMC